MSRKIIRNEKLGPTLHAVIKAVRHARKSVKNDKRDLLLAVLKVNQRIFKIKFEQVQNSNFWKIEHGALQVPGRIPGNVSWHMVKCEVLKKGSHLQV